MSDLQLAVNNDWATLQAREALRVEVLARDLFSAVGVDYDTADRRTKARARYLMTQAVRCLTSDAWEQEGAQQAQAAMIAAMRGECGTVLRNLSPEQYASFARILFYAAWSAYTGLTQGSSPIPPGDYLRLTQGDR